MFALVAEERRSVLSLHCIDFSVVDEQANQDNFIKQKLRSHTGGKAIVSIKNSLSPIQSLTFFSKMRFIHAVSF